MLWLYLDFCALQLDALDSSRPPLKTELTPAQEVLIIVDAKKNEVVQHNDMAKQQGIVIGMGLATALSLHPQVHVIEYKPDLEYKKLHQLAQLLYQLTADIALSFPHGLYLRIDNMLCLYGGLTQYWQHIQQVLSDIGFQYHYASGNTPFMAKVLAQAKFDRLLDTPAQLRTALHQLSIEQLELEPKALKALWRVGVKTTEQLFALPLKEMAKRFDIQLLNYLGKLQGDFKHGLSFYQPPAQFDVDIELLFEIGNSDILQHPIKRLLVQLQAFLSLRELVTQQITLHLLYRYDDYIEVRVSRSQGEYKAEKWLSLIKLRLESVKLAEPVVSIRLIADKLRPVILGSRDLFHTQLPQTSPGELLAILQAKLGEAKVKAVTLNDQHHPQFSSGYRELLDGELIEDNEVSSVSEKKRPETEVHNRSGDVKSSVHKLRPSLMAAKATPLRDRVTILHGPERLQTSWWHEHAIQRDYFIARSDSGKLYWVFRTPQKNWYLHGYFA